MNKFIYIITVVSIFLSGCENRVQYDYSEQRGSFLNPNSISFPNTIILGESIVDSVDVTHISNCIVRAYFKVDKIENFKYEFEVLHVTSEPNTPPRSCNGTQTNLKAPFSFTPTQKGTYTLHLIDIRDTITKTLVVN
jgi:hypothetical protein